ncbi:MAG: LPS-assembly protein LptD [Leptospiraceae bacterium]|nr:LPS-assembly protein LptD [Leptospiraceae bacterium]MCK6380574.1 LPS-assembly protein LptD [Leptospiraceae bacterium]NUM40345.1 LPS-assembly protein LptD [Leptospiraceae bacterium]
MFLLFLVPEFLFSQDQEFIRQIFPDERELVKNSKDEEKNYSVTQIQKKLIRRVFDTLSDREIDTYLRQMGLPVSGSIYVKKRRLRDAVGGDEEGKSKELPEPELTSEKKMPIVIENASEGELMSVDKTNSGVLILRGNVKLKVGKGKLIANSVFVDSKKQEIYAEGGIEFKDGGISIKGDKFIYDVKLQRGVVYDTKASYYPAYFVGKKIKKLDEKRYLLEMGYFTACGAEVPHYTFKAGKIILYQDETMVATNLRYQVGGTTLFWFPMLYTSNLGSGWVTQIGHNMTQGWFFQNSYQWSVPSATQSSWIPMGYKAKLDWYEKSGQVAALDTWKLSPSLNYILDLGYANHKNYSITSAFDDRFRRGGLGNVATTNQVDRGEYHPFKGNSPFERFGNAYYSQELASRGIANRDIGVQYEPWWKMRFILNAKKNNNEKDGTRNFQINYENYNNSRYEYEYGNRYEPTNTLRAIYNRRNQRFGMMRQNLGWTMDYSENRGDLSVNVSAKRNLIFNILTPSSRSNYFPIIDQVPTTTIKNSSQIGSLPYFDSPVYWDITLNNSLTRYYGAVTKTPLKTPTLEGSTDDPFGQYKASLIRTQILTLGETGFKTTMNFGSYASLSPSVYYGARKESAERPNPSVNDVALDRVLRRESYEFLKQAHNFRLGAPVLFLNVNYRKIEARKSELPEKVVGKNRVHEAEISLESMAFQDFEFSIRTIRDLRTPSPEYNPQPMERERWYFSVFRASGFFDFIEGFGNKKASYLESQRSFYSGIFVNNDFVYHTALGRPLSNNLTIAYQLGGFSLPFVKNFRNLEIGGTWYHVYNSPILDGYRFYIQSDIQVTKNTGFELQLDSRVTQPWRLTDQMTATNAYGTSTYSQSMSTVYQPTNLDKDILTGMGVDGLQGRQTTAFNVNKFMLVLKHNLHNWEYRLGYSMDLRSIAGGSSFDNQVIFYDQSVFFTISLINVNLGQGDSTESTRSRLYRFRKKPLQVGQKSSITSEAY